MQSGRFLGSSLNKLAGSLMKVAVPLAKNILAPLRITAAASVIDAGVQKKIHGSGTTTLTISNAEMNDIMKIVQAVEYSNILLKGFTKTIKKKTKEQQGEFLSMLLATLGARSVRKHFSWKRNCKRWFWEQKRIRNCKSWLWKRMAFLMSPHSLKIFEILKYYQNESKFNGVFSRNNLPKKK